MRGGATEILLLPVRHVSNYGGYSVVARRNSGHAAASTKVTSDLGDLCVARDPHIIIQFEHRAVMAKTLRSRMFFGSVVASVRPEPLLQVQLSQQELIEVRQFKSDSTHQQAVGKFEVHTSVVSSSIANSSAEDLDLGCYVVSM